MKRDLEELGEEVSIVGSVISLSESAARVVWRGRLGG
jgi:hypothetical protein